MAILPNKNTLFIYRELTGDQTLSNEFVLLFLSTLKKFTPKGQELILRQMHGYRRFFKMDGQSLKSLTIWDIKDRLSLGGALPIEKELINKTESLDDIVDNIIMTIRRKGVPRGKGTALCKKTGIQEPIHIDEVSNELFNRAENTELCARNVQGELLGKMEIGETLAKTKDKRVIYIYNIATNDKYEGVGTELIRRAVEFSEKIGLKGRVKLTSWTGQLPEDYLAIAGTKSKKVSSAIKYHEMGFGAIDPELEQRIVRTIEEGGTGLSEDGAIDYLAGHMELTEDGIRKFLA